MSERRDIISVSPALLFEDLPGSIPRKRHFSDLVWVGDLVPQGIQCPSDFPLLELDRAFGPQFILFPNLSNLLWTSASVGSGFVRFQSLQEYTLRIRLGKWIVKGDQSPKGKKRIGG